MIWSRWYGTWGVLYICGVSIFFSPPYVSRKHGYWRINLLPWISVQRRR